MAEDFLESIYREAELLCQVRQTVAYARVHDDLHTVAMCDKLLPKLRDACKRYMEWDAVRGKRLWAGVMALMSIQNDLIYLGDILERNVLHPLTESMGQWGGIRMENEEGDYLFESTASGFLTIKDVRRNCYLHSMTDPMWEARQVAESIYEPEYWIYSLRGCGLGYLAYQLYEISGGTLSIQVFEKDARMVEYARKYGVLDWVPQEKLKIVVEEDPTLFLESALENGTKMHMFAPQFEEEAEDIRPILDEVDILLRTNIKHKREDDINYWSNLRNCKRNISEFDASAWKKEYIITAGGPSLDESMEFILKNRAKVNVITVGTVFNKLLSAGIVPDAVVIIESDRRVYKQFEGLEDQKVPLFFLDVAYWKVIAAYQGEKYRVPARLNPSGKRKEDLWDIGGTVTTLAIDVAVRFGAETVYLAGADLSYPGGISHAQGTAYRTEMSTAGMVPLESVGGGTVYADTAMHAYLKEIEERIEKAPQVTWYNLSRIGAKIKGTVAYEGEGPVAE